MKKGKLKLLKLQGKDYLPVQQRVLWFREEHPDWSIETELILGEEREALAKAIVKDEKGRTLATAHKTENYNTFRDYIEKAETGAIGRALALVGYGTQFALDLDEGERVVDAPIGRVSQLTSSTEGEKQTSPSVTSSNITEKSKGMFTVKKSKQPVIRERNEEDEEAPDCCEKSMMVSKYDENLWYCTMCKTKKVR